MRKKTGMTVGRSFLSNGISQICGDQSFMDFYLIGVLRNKMQNAYFFMAHLGTIVTLNSIRFCSSPSDVHR